MLSLASTFPLVAQEKPARRFSLSARLGAVLDGNRVECGVSATGQVCGNVHSGTTPGGFWPAGTSDNYIFRSGLVVAGIIGAGGGPWAGDTTGGFFFDLKGTTEHGTAVEGLHDSRDPADFAAWPERARVPDAGPGSPFFHPSIRGRPAASDHDLWWVMTEADPALSAGRPHPLGIVVEARAMAFGWPAGADDVVFVLYTLYNATSLDQADYAAASPAMQPLLLEQARLLHSRALATLGVTLPTGGYTIRQAYAGTQMDADVADAGANWEVINPASRYTFTYASGFGGIEAATNYGWTFDPGIFESPFFPGPGFVAYAPLGGSAGVTEFEVATNYTGSATGLFAARNARELWIHTALRIVGSPELGGSCNQDPVTTRICYQRTTSPFDIRGFTASALPDLPPGGSATLAVAYVFAPPVAVPGFVPGPLTNVPPGAPVLPFVDSLLGGVPLADSIAGYAGYEDVNGDGLVGPEEFLAVPGSLKHKAQLARAFFQAGFLRPAAPEAPEFFLIPGDGKVTVVWQPSGTEEAGDPYADLAEAPRRADGTINQLFDPNFRRFDVEGYRIWRGRTDRPEEMELVAQFDHDDTAFRDHDGLVAHISQNLMTCAPELGVLEDCPVAFDPVVPGAPRIAAAEVPLRDGLVQVRVDGQRPQRIRLASGLAYPIRVDTAVTGGGSGFPPLGDTGIPFLFTDSTVANGFRYFYAVTAFDVNSIRSGPSSLESVRLPKAVRPREDASNLVTGGGVGEVEILGRNGPLARAPVPTLDPATGNFSGPFPALASAELLLEAFSPELFAQGGEVTARLDSLTLGSAYGEVPHVFWYTATVGGEVAVIRVPVTQDPLSDGRQARATLPGLALDEVVVAPHGGSAAYALPTYLRHWVPGGYHAGGYGRGCVNAAPGFTAAGLPAQSCAYNGSRWFDGPSPLRNETVPHPQRGNTEVSASAPMADLNNGGALTGVRTIFQPQAYISASPLYRQVEGVLGGARRSTDYNVYWGSGGTVDSVVDVSYDVIVPFSADRIGATWGILNAEAAQPSGTEFSYDQRVELTTTDFACVEPLRSDPAASSHMPCGTGTGPAYVLSRTAIPGPVAAFSGLNTLNARTAPVLPEAGFAMHLVGNIFLFELEGGQVPAAGTVWSLRDYVGAIAGGGCPTCGDGEYPVGYTFYRAQPQPFTAVGATLRVAYEPQRSLRAPTPADLARAHPVPDPYYALQALGLPEEQQGIAFVHLPAEAVVRIYSASGRLVKVLEHATDAAGTVRWDVRNRAGDPVASGIYFYHIEAGRARKTGRMTIVNSASRGGD